MVVIARNTAATYSLSVGVCGLRVVLFEDSSVFSEQSLFLLFDNVCVASVLGHLGFPLGKLDGALLSINCKLLLPETLDLASVLELAHSSLLLGHLLKALVLGKLSEQFLFEILFEAFLFCSALSLQTHLEILGFLQLTTGLILLVLCLLLSLSGGKFIFLYVKLVSEVLTELSLSTTGHLLLLKTAEDSVTLSLSLVFGGLNLVEALLLLLSILTNHFIFVGLHLLLTLNKSTFLVHRKNHVCLCLLHFKVLDTGHFSIFRNHTLDNSVNLITLLKVLFTSLDFELLAINYLLLDCTFVAETILFAGLFCFSLDLILNFLRAKHDLVNLGVLFLQNKTYR